MWTSNSGPPFNQPSKSSTKWAFVRYRPGPVGGGGGSHRLPHDRHSMAAGVVEKSVSTGTTAITGVAGVAQRERKGARQELGGSRRREDIRPTRGVGCGARWAVGAGERAHQQGERRGP